MTLKELAAGARLAPSAAHRYLVSLARVGLVQQDGATRLYDLGPSAVVYGLAAIHRSKLLARAKEVQLELRSNLDESTLLAIWGTHGPVIVNVAESSKAIMLTMRVGATMPLLRTATGLVFAAFLPRHVVTPVLQAEIAAGRPHPKMKSPKSLEAGLAEVKEQRLAFHDGNLLPGVRAVASPLFDWGGQLVAVLSAFGLGTSFDPSPEGTIAKKLKAAASSFPENQLQP